MKPSLPSIPTKDVDRFSVSWIRQLLDCLKYAMDTPRGDGTTIFRNGATISARRSGAGASGGGEGGTGAYPCQISGGQVGGAFPVYVHKNGRDKTRTGQGYIQVLQLHLDGNTPSGTWLMGFETTLTNYNDEE